MTWPSAGFSALTSSTQTAPWLFPHRPSKMPRPFALQGFCACIPLLLMGCFQEFVNLDFYCLSHLRSKITTWEWLPGLFAVIVYDLSVVFFMAFTTLYVCMYAYSLSHVLLFALPWTAACQAPLPMEFSRQEYWSKLPFSPPGDPPNSGIEPAFPVSSVFSLADRLFTTERPGKPLLLSAAAAAAAKSFQSCPTLCNPIDGSPPGSPNPGILQARTLEWVAMSFSNAWKWKVKVKSLSRVRLLVTPWTAAYQAPPSMGFSRQGYQSGVPLP